LGHLNLQTVSRDSRRKASDRYLPEAMGAPRSFHDGDTTGKGDGRDLHCCAETLSNPGPQGIASVVGRILL
jgi:hypothetical protein